MSEKQLLLVAKRLGKEWKQVAIYLGLNSKDLDEIQASEKDVTMQKLKMLVKWKSGRLLGEATAYHMWESVEELDDLPVEVRQTLQGNKLQTPDSTYHGPACPSPGHFSHKFTHKNCNRKNVDKKVKFTRW